MKKSPFWFQVGILCLGFALLNVLVKKFVHGSVPHVMLSRIRSEPNPTHVFVGNSVVAAGAKTDLMKELVPASRPINIAIGGSKPADYFLVFNELKTSPTDKPRIYIGFFDRELTDTPHNDWSDLMSNRSICYLVDMNHSLRLLAPNNPLLQMQMRVTKELPLLVERGTLWNRVEQMKRKIGELGMPKQETNEFGRVGDFAALEEKDVQEFAKKCAEAITNNTPFNPSIQSIIEQTKERGGQLFFVDMPMPAEHRRFYYSSPQWKAYREHIKALVTQAGAQYINASEWIPDSSFTDHLHMNPTGGDAFTKHLMAVTKQD